MRKFIGSYTRIRTKGPIIIISALILFLLILGCAGPRKPTLPEMFRWDVQDFNDKQLKGYLDQSYPSEENRRKYWRPMMDRIIIAKTMGSAQKLWVPMNHLERAVTAYSKSSEFERQEPAVYLYYWQLFSDVSTRQKLYGFSKDWKKGNEGEKRTYLRKYMPALFNRHRKKGYESFKKMYKLVKQHDPQLVKELFGIDPFKK